MNASAVNAVHAEVANKQWHFSCDWASRLTDKQLSAAKRLNIPGDAGLAISQEYGRRHPLF